MKMKKLLAAALAATMMLSSMVTSFVASAAETVGTITVGTAEVELGVETADVDVTINFTKEGGVTAPHDLFTLTAPEGFTITDASVTYEGTAQEGGKGVYIDPDGEDFASGKILLEAPVDEYAPTVTKIVVAVTYAIADTVVAGEYAITVDSEIADITETDLTLTEEEGKIIVKEAHVCDMQTKYDETGHWTECTCGEKTDVVAHELVDGDITTEPTCDDAGVQEQKCDCGYTTTKALDPKGHTEVEIPAVDATCTTPGSTAGVKCSVCDAIITAPTEIPVIPHDFAEGTCTVCGAEDPNYEPPVQEPVVNDALASVVWDVTPRVENTFGIRYDLYINPADYGADSFEFRVTRSELDTANGFVYSEPKVYTYTAEDTEDSSIAGYNMYVYSHSFPLYEMQVPTTYSIHLFKDGVEVSYYAYAPHTLTQVATKRYNDKNDENLRKILVACLNVGTKAQELFAAKPETSANSPLKTYGAPNADVDTVTYATPYDSLNATAGSVSGAIYSTSVTLGVAPTLRCDLYDASLMNAADSFYAEATYNSKYTGKTELYTFSGTSLQDSGYGMYALEFDKTFLFDTDKEITVNIKKNDGTVVGTATSTIDALLLANVNADGIRGEAFQAVASFAACCRIFFPNF